MAVKTALNQKPHRLQKIRYFRILQGYMENFEQRWKEVELFLQERFGKLPDMEGILFLIGVNEFGNLPRRKFSKEQKQDLMHVAVCKLLSQFGYYEYEGVDGDGWPHYMQLKPVETAGLNGQERLLKEAVIDYFGK